jgi:hypothetical protein
MPVDTVLIPAFEYYYGLRIFDESGKELSFYRKQDTIQFFYDIIEDEKEKPEKDRDVALLSQYQSILEKLQSSAENSMKIIWVEFHQDNQLQAHSLKKIKLVYTDAQDPKNLSFSEAIRKRAFLKRQSFLFSVPQFPNAFVHNNELHDVFVLIRVPECSVLDYQVEINNEQYDIKSGAIKGFSVENNGRTIIIKIPSNQMIEVFFQYYVSPPIQDRALPITLFSVLMGFSLFMLFYQNHILFLQQNIMPIYGGFFGATFASIGLLRQQYTNRTRLWILLALIPISVPPLLKLLT